jgi:Tol biopolymer transport system component
LQRFDSRPGVWEPHLAGNSADYVEYANDGQRVAYVTHPGGELWVRRVDGSQPVQLTQAPMRALEVHWSPDGNTIAFAAKIGAGEPWSIYLADAAGGKVRPACPKECRAMGLAWMSDGKQIVFSAPTAQFYTQKAHLSTLDLATGDVTPFPGSEGLHSPRLSPDGSTLAALVHRSLANADRLMLYRFSERTWREFPSPGFPSWPRWSRDGESIWYYNLRHDSIMRFRIRESRHEEILKLKSEEMTGFFGFWFNLTPEDEPMTLRRRDFQQIYALEWKTR